MTLKKNDIDPDTEEVRISTKDAIVPTHVLLCTMEKSAFDIAPNSPYLVDIGLELPQHKTSLAAAAFYQTIDQAHDLF